MTNPNVRVEETVAAEQHGRVTVEEDVRAYGATGTRPDRGTFARFARPGGTGGAVLEAPCGVGVLVEAGSIPRLADGAQ